MRKIIAIISLVLFVVALVAFSTIEYEYRVNFEKEKWELSVKGYSFKSLYREKSDKQVSDFLPSDDIVCELKNGVLTASGEGMLSKCFSDDIKKQITTVILEEGITGVDYNTFWRCDNLTTVVLPSTIKKLDSDSFACSNIKKVYYNGSKEERNEIDMGWENGLYGGDWILSSGETYEEEGLVDDLDFFNSSLK